jgi:hypothetical protein
VEALPVLEILQVRISFFKDRRRRNVSQCGSSNDRAVVRSGGKARRTVARPSLPSTVVIAALRSRHAPPVVRPRWRRRRGADRVRAIATRHAAPDEPTEHELATLAAIAETFLPGGDGAPGASDTGALAAIVDPAYGLRPYLAQVVADLDDWVATATSSATTARTC